MLSSLFDRRVPLPPTDKAVARRPKPGAPDKPPPSLPYEHLPKYGLPRPNKTRKPKPGALDKPVPLPRRRRPERDPSQPKPSRKKRKDKKRSRKKRKHKPHYGEHQPIVAGFTVVLFQGKATVFIREIPRARGMSTPNRKGASAAKSRQSSGPPSKKRKTDGGGGSDKEQKYYAVRAGHKPGVYTSWAICQQQISGFKGAMCKSLLSSRGPC